MYEYWSSHGRRENLSLSCFAIPCNFIPPERVLYVQNCGHRNFSCEKYRSSLRWSAKSTEYFCNVMDWKVMNFSSVLLLEMKFELHTIRLKPRDSPNSSVIPVYLQSNSSKLPFRPKNHGISVLRPQRYYIEWIFASGKTIPNSGRYILRPYKIERGLLHDNARPHTANFTKQLLDSFERDVWNYP